ncbi:integrase family protein [Methylobacterium sp. 4-46]|uniref:tyrosine-type recombinase/integrase n=1 Tax=unclassified Methylobacterium TaxID=2615210 RepID=UPI000152BEF7|nr:MULTISPECIES: site-specific integrase [Methylobacterium]ACA18348.1 integrase family protein [Methylobacterium sp. 4-46]WFT77645.1 integrase arm-type DNA-binding domain-containing protein [Methylobacterium nodulans]
MARPVKRLSARSVATITKPGRHADGDGLYLVVDPSGAKRWLFLFRWHGKLKEMGLGGLSTVSLAEAREAASEARRLVKSGRNPIEQRRAAKSDEAALVTFGAFADKVVTDLAPGFRNDKHKAQWAMTLTTYAAPLRPMPVEAIGTEDVLRVLEPIWQTKSETASRLRGRIERVLDAAKAKGLRTGENPARWRGHLDKLLPARRKLTRGHHAAMPFEDVPAFLAALREREAAAALALEFCILNASRSGEVLGSCWGEIDRKAKVWIVPAERMKAGREHRVPLTSRALEILDHVEAVRAGDLVFPGQKRNRPLSVMAMEMLLRRMQVPYTVHGFRSSFRDWAGERTSYPREIAETALAHVVGDATERAYRRGDALEKRRKLMEEWAAYCAKGE